MLGSTTWPTTMLLRIAYWTVLLRVVNLLWIMKLVAIFVIFVNPKRSLKISFLHWRKLLISWRVAQLDLTSQVVYIIWLSICLIDLLKFFVFRV